MIKEFKSRNKKIIFGLRYKNYVAEISGPDFSGNYNYSTFSGPLPTQVGQCGSSEDFEEVKEMAKSSLETLIIVCSRKRPNFLRN